MPHHSSNPAVATNDTTTITTTSKAPHPIRAESSGDGSGFWMPIG
jgi:hypothetical protein